MIRRKRIPSIGSLAGCMKSDIKLTDEQLYEAKGDFEENWARRDGGLVCTIGWIVEELTKLNIKWFVGGSAGLVMQGVKISPRDIDIIVVNDDKLKVNRVINKIRDVSYLPIEIVGVDEDKFGNPVEVEYYGNKVWVNRLEDELKYYKSKAGKESVVKLIEEKVGSFVR